MRRCFVIAVALLGCGNQQLEELQQVRDEVCACKTPECGEAALKKVPQGKLESNRKMQAVASAMMDCMAKLNDVDRPSTDPDAEVPPTPGSAAGPP